MIHRYQEMSRYWRHWILTHHTIRFRLQVQIQSHEIVLQPLHSRTHRLFLLSLHQNILEAQHLHKFARQAFRNKYNNQIDFLGNLLSHQHNYMGCQRWNLSRHHHRPLLSLSAMKLYLTNYYYRSF